MINPNKIHSRGIVRSKDRFGGGTIQIGPNIFETALGVDLSRFEIGDVVSISCSYRITSDRYVIDSVRKVRS
jgi:hypothetical protein